MYHIGSALGALNTMGQLDQRWSQQASTAWHSLAAQQTILNAQFVPKTEYKKIPTKSEENTTMFTELKNDLKNFFRSHKGTIYTLLAIYLVDHLFLNGKLREKLTLLVNKLLKTVENKIDKAIQSEETVK